MWGLDLKWNHDYPRGETHFMKILKETTTLDLNPAGETSWSNTLNEALAATEPYCSGPLAHRHSVGVGLPVAHHQHVGHLLQLGLTNLIFNLLLALVEVRPQPGRFQPVPHRWA